MISLATTLKISCFARSSTPATSLRGLPLAIRLLLALPAQT